MAFATFLLQFHNYLSFNSISLFTNIYKTGSPKLTLKKYLIKCQATDFM